MSWRPSSAGWTCSYQRTARAPNRACRCSDQSAGNRSISVGSPICLSVAHRGLPPRCPARAASAAGRDPNTHGRSARPPPSRRSRRSGPPLACASTSAPGRVPSAGPGRSAQGPVQAIPCSPPTSRLGQPSTQRPGQECARKPHRGRRHGAPPGPGRPAIAGRPPTRERRRVTASPPLAAPSPARRRTRPPNALRIRGLERR